eukprot:CAMPEP_0184737114 /NCGR_PEP_ID=MMETSP0314-20130426/62741_1 /TAXON_ID=38298 /ORGANISM="Rhodella maculata, Strain CCMP 736" /LENGTH=149 /DNA_ID=CAMNT_0027204179 /DNA_START=248 /DNA_END=694 /DNA_ORIENTATION=+
MERRHVQETPQWGVSWTCLRTGAAALPLAPLPHEGSPRLAAKSSGPLSAPQRPPGFSNDPPKRLVVYLDSRRLRKMLPPPALAKISTMSALAREQAAGAVRGCGGGMRGFLDMPPYGGRRTPFRETYGPSKSLACLYAFALGALCRASP